MAYNENYQYDALGNLTSKAGVGSSYGTQSGACTSGALHKPHAVTQTGSSGYCYDRNGNLLGGVGRTYTWNPATSQRASPTRTG